MAYGLQGMTLLNQELKLPSLWRGHFLSVISFPEGGWSSVISFPVVLSPAMLGPVNPRPFGCREM